MCMRLIVHVFDMHTVTIVLAGVSDRLESDPGKLGGGLGRCANLAAGL